MGGLPLADELLQELKVDRFDQVVVEAGNARLLAILLLPIAGDGDQQTVARLAIAARTAAATS